MAKRPFTILLSPIELDRAKRLSGEEAAAVTLRRAIHLGLDAIEREHPQNPRPRPEAAH